VEEGAENTTLDVLVGHALAAGNMVFGSALLVA
jgi:hypothetical protein